MLCGKQTKQYDGSSRMLTAVKGLIVSSDVDRVSPMSANKGRKKIFKIKFGASGASLHFPSILAVVWILKPNSTSFLKCSADCSAVTSVVSSSDYFRSH